MSDCPKVQKSKSVKYLYDLLPASSSQVFPHTPVLRIKPEKLQNSVEKISSMLTRQRNALNHTFGPAENYINKTEVYYLRSKPGQYLDEQQKRSQQINLSRLKPKHPASASALHADAKQVLASAKIASEPMDQSKNKLEASIIADNREPKDSIDLECLEE